MPLLATINDSEVHKGLSLSDLRDHIAKIFATPMKYERENYTFTSNMTDEEYFHYQMQLVRDKQQNLDWEREHFCSRFATQQVMKQFGWSDFDISEHFQRRGDLNLFRNFIGTLDELKTLYLQLDLPLDRFNS